MSTNQRFQHALIAFIVKSFTFILVMGIEAKIGIEIDHEIVLIEMLLIEIFFPKNFE